MDVLLSSLLLFFLLERSKGGRERDYSISSVLFPSIQRRPGFFKNVRRRHISTPYHSLRVEILPDKSTIHIVRIFS